MISRIHGLPSRRSLLVVVLALGACAGPTRTVREPGEDADTYRSEATIHGSQERASIEMGRAAAIRGDYTEAIETFLGVYEKTSADAKHRAEALMELGDAYRSPLNPRHSSETAMSYYAKLVEEFPGSELKAKAEQALRELQPVSPDTAAPR